MAIPAMAIPAMAIPAMGLVVSRATAPGSW